MGIDVVFPNEEEDIIDQSEKVKKETAQHMGQMGWLFDKVHEKLGNDKECFRCKKEINVGDEVQITNIADTPKGVIAFCSLCKECVEELSKEIEQKENGKEEKIVSEKNNNEE